MKKIALACVLTITAFSAYAQTSCEELKVKIDTKLQAKGVKGYTLEAIATDAVKDQKVVGSCDGGKKKMTYKRG